MSNKCPVNITSFVKLALMLPEWKSILVRGVHGIGKSQIVSQIADKLRAERFNGEGFPLIDQRLSQLTEGDIIGLPKMDEDSTRFQPADWYMKACKEPCCLFLDELNRATPEVMQAAFQIVLDRQLQGHKLHPQTRVYAAINANASYIINEVDPALLDRFWAVDLEPTVQEWLDWAKTRDDMCHTVIDFIRLNEPMLDPNLEAELGTIGPSRRSWHHLSRVLIANDLVEKPKDPMFYSLCVGFIGLEPTIAFTDYCNTFATALTPEDIIEKLVTKLGPIKHKKKKYDTINEMIEKITDEEEKSEAVIDIVRTINKFEKNDKDELVSIDKTTYDESILKRLSAMGAERVNALSEKIADYILTKYANTALTDIQGAALAKYASMIPGEIRLPFWQKCISRGIEDMTLNASVHRWLMPQILNIFDMEPGKRGANMTPNIPSYLQQS